MSLIYDEIFVGEKNRAMGILASSLPKSDSNTLAHHLDLPGQPPQGFSLDTYVSGLVIGDYYVISRTSHDPLANRPGVVFSHAFVFDKKSIEQLDNIQNLFRLLHHKRPSKFDPSQRSVEAKPKLETLPSGLVCDKLTNSPLSTIVTTNSDSYEDIVARIWSRLLPSMRPNFRFKLSFDPAEAARENLNIALVPLTVLPRWPQDQRIDEYDVQAPASTLAGKSLAASDSGQLYTFIKSLELKSVELSMYGLLGRACELTNSNVCDFNLSLAALRLIGKLQEDPSKGIETKTQVAGSVILAPGPKSPENILALRNLNWAPFSLTKLSLSNLQGRFNECFQLSGHQLEKQAMIESVLEEDQANTEWKKTGESTLVDLDEKVANGLAAAAWEILSNGGVNVEKLLSLVPNKILDEAIATSKEISVDSTTHELRKILASHQYFKTEALLLMKHYDGNSLAALAEACQRDRQLFSDTAIIHILNTLSHSDKVQSAVNIDDSLVIESACKSVADDPSLLISFNLMDVRIQSIWEAALTLSPDAWQIEKEPSRVQDKIWNVLNKSKVKPSLLKAIMKTPVGNWSEHKSRPNIWQFLSGESLGDALDRTAAGWITTLPTTIGNLTPPLEPPLATAIAEQHHQISLLDAFKKCTFNEVIKVFANNEPLSSELFFNALISKSDSNHQFSTEEAERAGQLASLRNWQSLTRKLFSKFGTFGQLRSYFSVCIDHLTIWELLFSGLRPPTPSDIDKLLLETSTKLYPTGPTDKDIWQRAGGDHSHLDLSGNGKDQWYRALQLINLGGSISIFDLLNHMLYDYPSNSELQKLKEII